MNKIRYFVILLILLIQPARSIFAQSDDYLIKFRIQGLKDTTVMIGNYYSNGTYIIDTLTVDAQGRCTYKAPANHPKGLYLFIITTKNYFDFVINNDRKFSMETRVDNPADHMVIKDSPDNKLFYDYLKENKAIITKIQGLQEQMKKVEGNKDSTDHYTKVITDLNKDLINYKLNLVKTRPESFIALMINAMKEPDIPEEIPTLPNGKKDSTFAYRYYKAHYWDDVDFTDPRLLRTPVFYNKMKKYLDNVLVQLPDTIIKEVDIFIEKSRPNAEMFKYMIWLTTYKYETSEIMGFDRIFVHIVDQYYVTGQASWVDKSTNEKIIKKANKIRNLLIGAKAPNMIMQDTSFQLVSMHNIKANYLMLLFWDPDCGHCNQDMPRIKEQYDTAKVKFGLEIMGICSDTSMAKMKEKIRKLNMTWINVNGPRTLTGDYHESYDIISTPVIYILDDKKEIIAKQLPHNKILEFLQNYSRRKKQ